MKDLGPRTNETGHPREETKDNNNQGSNRERTSSISVDILNTTFPLPMVSMCLNNTIYHHHSLPGMKFEEIKCKIKEVNTGYTGIHPMSENNSFYFYNQELNIRITLLVYSISRILLWTRKYNSTYSILNIFTDILKT